ncbi:MAG TPA: hypothetical protein VIR29_05225 [Anseongella sp.]
MKNLNLVTTALLLSITALSCEKEGPPGLTGAEGQAGENVMPSLSNKFRYIVIPGGVKATAALNGIDLSNYKAVSQALNIHD